MQRKQEFICSSYEDGMNLAVTYFHINEEKIFLSVLEEKENEMRVEALVDINLALEGKKYLEAILTTMGIEYQLEIRTIKGPDGNEKEIHYNIHSAENPILIGNHGKTLEALQILVRDLLQNYTREDLIVNVDCGDYKSHRKHQLEILATKTAKEVARTKVQVKLNPMTSYERRIIHSKLADWKDVYTESEGEGADRAIVIKPKQK